MRAVRWSTEAMGQGGGEKGGGRTERKPEEARWGREFEHTRDRVTCRKGVALIRVLCVNVGLCRHHLYT